MSGGMAPHPDTSASPGAAGDHISAVPPPPSPPPPPPPPEDVPQTDTSGATISRGPVRYEAPPSAPPLGPPSAERDEEMDVDEPAGNAEADSPAADAPRSNRPGQAGFAQRLMAKYGWTKGAGLGANESGIVDALRVKVEKRKRKPDAEGGGFAEPGNRGKIIGGKRLRRQGGGEGEEEDEEDEGPGKMSEVIVLRGMLEGMPDLRTEVEEGLAQEIGEECGEKHGRVERLYIDIDGRQVFIKFTDQVSALRALNALQGRIFNGNTIVPKFYDPDKFADGVYH